MPALASTLLQQVAIGDEEAVRACIDRFGGLVWSLARRMVGPAEAEDAVQEVFVEVWNNAHKFDPMVASETAFVAMLARRRLIDRRRRMSRAPARAAFDDGVVDPAMLDGVKPAEPADSADGRRAWDAMQSLSPEQQAVLRLSIVQGLPHEKIARSMGLPLGTVKTHARRGLIRLRQLLGQSAPAVETRVGRTSESEVAP